MDSVLFASLLAIIWIDLLLSGDNAVVIALVCRELPKSQQTFGMVLGTGTAIVLRIIMALTASFLLSVEGLRIAGGLFVLWVAFGLLKENSDEDDGIKPHSSLLKAILAIGIADASMSLDNVIAVAALAKGHIWIMVFGIVISIPILIAGAAIIKGIVDRFPWIVWFGAGLLGWVGGSIILEDPFIQLLSIPPVIVEYSLLSVFSCLAILFAGYVYRNRKMITI